ncbi:F-box protein At5g07610 [Mercurialis annua]|uniref:F-box protein At5g07610 n=1 Tax=Mercurialis annua TaxID=3986 RepID=UPI00215E96D8|nr:F-box protein At5g07610 [Mercurialis annua]
MSVINSHIKFKINGQSTKKQLTEHSTLHSIFKDIIRLIKSTQIPIFTLQNLKIMVSPQRIKTISSSSSSSSSSRSFSAETIANDDDLLTQILLYLPIRALLKFKCVSKHWLSLISNPHFTRRLNLSDSPSGLFVHINKWPRSDNHPEFDYINLDPINNRCDAPFRILNFANEPSGIRILQSCNGLLLCCSNLKYGSEANYYVYNPTTRQFTLPPPLHHLAEIHGPYLAFDPSKSPHYSVIYLRQNEVEDTDLHIEIYSTKTGIWKVSDSIFQTEHDIGFHGGVFWNGAIHWYTDSGPSICFDVDQEQVKEMPMPPMPDEWYRRRVMYFGESRGCLYLVEIYHPPSTQFNVCEMEKDYSGWFVKYRVDLNGVAGAYPEMIRLYLDPSVLNHYAFQIMSIVKGESDEEDSFMVLHIPGKVIRYNFKDNSFEKIFDFDQQVTAGNFSCYPANEYIKSVASVW